jgi:UDP-glucose 4-epimerase|tara:strand:+ start:1960 stop:2949 length:990 start_codon:yes stop_codon:yes gene_type:complete
MNIIVTGGAGYIGSNIALALLDAGYEVTIIDNLSTGNERLIPSKAEFVKCNINDIEKLENLINKKKFTAIMHFAGFVEVEESVSYPEKYFENNTTNSIKLFDLCLQNGLSNIIFSSTATVYGNPAHKGLVSETNDIKPINPYGESKVRTENYLRQFDSSKINYIILRYFNVAGADPKTRSGLIKKNPTHLIKIASEAAIGKRSSVQIFGNDYNTPDGTAIRDYIHVSDLADIHIKVLQFLLEKKQSEIFNCGYGKGYSVKDVLNVTNSLCKNRINILNSPRRMGDAEMVVSDIGKLKRMIDWTPKYNKLDFIIKTAIDWELKLQNEQIS